MSGLLAVVAVSGFLIAVLLRCTEQYPWQVFGCLLLTSALTSAAFFDDRLQNLPFFRDLQPVFGPIHWLDLLTADRLFVGLLVLAALKRGRRSKTSLRARGGVEWAMALLATWLLVNTLSLSVNPFFGLRTTLDAFVLPFAGFWSLRRLVAGETDLEAFRRSMMVLGLVLVGWVVVERFTADLIVGITARNIFYYRVHGPFPRATWLGPVLGAVYFSTLMGFESRVQRRDPWRLASWVLLLSVPIAMLFTLTRALVAAFSVATLGLVVTGQGSHCRRTALLAGPLTTAALIAVVFWAGRTEPPVRDGKLESGRVLGQSGNELEELRKSEVAPLLLERLGNRSNIVYRLETWQVLLEDGFSHPLTGIGLHNAREQLSLARDQRSLDISHTPHSSHLAIAVETGFVGLSLYLVIVLGISGIAFRMILAPSDPSSNWHAAVLLACTVSYQIPALIDNNLYLPGLPNILFFALAGAIIGRSEQVEPPTTHVPTLSPKDTCARPFAEYRVAYSDELCLRARLAQCPPWRLAGRLTSMPLGEIGHRLGALTRDSKKGWPGLSSSSGVLSGLHSQLGAHPRTILARWLEEGFFFAPKNRAEMVKILQRRAPLGAARTIQFARQALDGGFDVLGQRVVLDPKTIDWRADPKTGISAWGDRSFGESDAVAAPDVDVKYVWELNRHAFIPLLGRAAWLTGDEVYARRAIGLIDSWIDANPHPVGINWSSPLEVAVRLIAWLWALPCLLESPCLDDTTLSHWLGSIELHCLHLNANLSLSAGRNNHVIGEAAALWMATGVLPGLRGAAKLQLRALQLLEKELERQVATDGVSREQSSAYQRFVLEFYLQVIPLGRRNGNGIDAAAEEHVARMVRVVQRLGAGGLDPAIGDGDDGRGLPFPESDSAISDVLSIGAVLFPDRRVKAGPGALEAAALWLDLNSGRLWDRIESSGSEPESCSFAKGGFHFLTTRRADAEIELVFNTGPMGLPPHAGHGHADALSVLLRMDDEMVIVDPGTFSYFEDASLRNAFRSTAAHATVSVDGLDQADAVDTFKWVNQPAVELLAADLGGVVEIVGASHGGYRRLRSPIGLKRWVVSVRPHGWIIVDEVETHHRCHLSLGFQLPADARVESHGERRRLVTTRIGHRLCFDFWPVPGALESIVAPLKDEPSGGVSTGYGTWRSAPRIGITATVDQPTVLVSLLSPWTGQTAVDRGLSFDQIDVRCLEGGGIRACATPWPGNPECGLVLLVNPEQRDVALVDGVATASRLTLAQESKAGIIWRLGVGSTGIRDDFGVRTWGHLNG